MKKNVYKQKDNEAKVLLKSFASEKEAVIYINDLYRRARAKKLYITRFGTTLKYPKNLCVVSFEYSKVELTDAGKVRSAYYRFFIE